MKITADTAAGLGLPHGIALPGGLAGLGLVLIVAILANLSSEKKKQQNDDGPDAAGAAAAGVLAVIARFATGRPLTGRRRSTATFWRSGVPILDPDDDRPPATALGTVGATTSPPDPSDLRVERATAAVETLRGRGPLGRAAAAAVLGIAAAGLFLGRLVLAAVRGLAHWSRWPYASRALVRLTVLAAVLGAWLRPAQTQQTALLAAVTVGPVLLVAIVTGPAGMGWWNGPTRTDEERFAPSVWAGVRRVLKIKTEQPHGWLSFPGDLSADGAAIIVHLPQSWLGTEPDRAALDLVIAARVPGRWRAQWDLEGDEHTATWRRAIDPYFGAEETAGALYGPGVWEAVRSVLKLDEDQVPQDWIQIPDDISDEHSRILVHLPLGWVPGRTGPEALTAAVARRIPGDWTAQWVLHGDDPRAEWTPTPKLARRPELPAVVEWEPTGDPRRVHVGVTHEGPAIIATQTATPHWGVGGATGAGKSTVLYIPIVHGRQNGELIDVLDTKRNSLIEAEGHSGVRIHKTPRACVTALAEFVVSMQSAEVYNGKAYRNYSGPRPVPRTLVIDEFPTLVQDVMTWWVHGLKMRGKPIILQWLPKILLQGRSADHRVVIGTQQFALSVFGTTMARAQVGTKIVIGDTDDPSWRVAYGPGTPRIAYNDDIPGRGAISVRGSQTNPNSARESVREIQIPYITPHVERLLSECASAPAWFDAGDPVPWTLDHVLEEAVQTAGVEDFYPGGRYALGTGVTPVTDLSTPLPVPRSEPVSPVPVTPGATLSKDQQDLAAQAAAAEAETDALPALYTLRQACETGVLPTTYDALRTRKSRESRKEDGIPFPEGLDIEGVGKYTADELLAWWNAVTTRT